MPPPLSLNEIEIFGASSSSEFLATFGVSEPFNSLHQPRRGYLWHRWSCCIPQSVHPIYSCLEDTVELHIVQPSWSRNKPVLFLCCKHKEKQAVLS